MLLVTPPAEVTEAVSHVAQNVDTPHRTAGIPPDFSLGRPETQWARSGLEQSVSMLATSMMVVSSIHQ
jgi:hypothetical protein